VPRFRKEKNASGTWESHLFVPAVHSGLSGRPRTLKRGERVHRSAVERFAALPDYRTTTLTGAGLTMPVAQAFLATPAEEWIVP